MLILVSGATPAVRKHFGHPNLGQLLTPHDGGKNLPGMSFAADNAAYSDWDETAFIRMLDRLKGTNPLFVTAPDYVGSARITNELFYQWAPEMEKRNLPIGYVLQDGQAVSTVPWDSISAIFIGGSTEFKFDDHVRYLISRAQKKGIWVHMGRVNTLGRLQKALEFGCDSVDGTGFSRFAELKLSRALRYLETAQYGLDFDSYKFAA
jgi:hypothetical protein